MTILDLIAALITARIAQDHCAYHRTLYALEQRLDPDEIANLLTVLDRQNDPNMGQSRSVTTATGYHKSILTI